MPEKKIAVTTKLSCCSCFCYVVEKKPLLYTFFQLAIELLSVSYCSSTHVCMQVWGGGSMWHAWKEVTVFLSLESA